MLKIFKKTKGYKLPIIALAGLIFAISSVIEKPESPAKEIESPPVSEFNNSVAGIGVVEPKSELIAISTEISGVIRNVKVKVGDEVKKDDALFSLDERDIDAQIKTLEAALQSAKIQQQDAEAQFGLVKNISDSRAVAKDDFNRRKFGSQLAAAKVNEISAQLEQAKTNKDRLTVRAPVDGKILEVNVRPGEFAAATALQTPLIRMGDVSTLNVRVEVDEENANKISETSKAIGYHRGDTKNSIPLTFVRFEPYVKPKQNLAVAGQRVDTRVLQVIYSISEPQKNVFVGQQMDVFIDNSK